MIRDRRTEGVKKQTGREWDETDRKRMVRNRRRKMIRNRQTHRMIRDRQRDDKQTDKE